MKKIKVLLSILILVIAMIGNRKYVKADDFEGFLTIVIEHTMSCGYENDDTSLLGIGQTHTFQAKIYETESGKDVTDQYTVDWEVDFYHGEVAEHCSISPNGNECQVDCIKDTQGYNILIFGKIMGDGEFLGIGYTEFKISDKPIDNEEEEIAAGEDASLVEGADATEDILSTTEAEENITAGSSSSSAGTIEKDTDNKKGRGAVIAIGTCGIAVILCGGALFLKRRRK